MGILGKFRHSIMYNEAVPGTPRPPRSRFHARSTAEDVTNGLDLSGMNILVTGCNSGIGLETMRVLALRGAHVLGTARSEAKAENACRSVEGRTTPLVVELTDFESIIVAAQKIRSMAMPLHGLVLNAGIMQLPELRQVHGLEMQFVVNHLGHFLLVKELLDNLAMATRSRVVTLSSRAYSWAPKGGIDFDNLDGSKSYDPRVSYGQSKLANALFARELARRAHDKGILSNAVHPGVITETNLDRFLPNTDEEQTDEDRGYIIKTIPEGASTSCYVATHPSLDKATGYYFADCNWEIPAKTMQNDEQARQLWDVSEQLVATILQSR